MKRQGLRRSPTHLLHRASQCVTDLFAREIKSDLTPRQLAVLTAIALNPGCSQTNLVDITGIDRSTLADLVRRLKSKGHLERRRTSADRRAYAIKLTDSGHRLLKSAEPLAIHVDQTILKALGSRGPVFLDSLARLSSRLSFSSS